MKIILLSGRQGSGKSSIQKFLGNTLYPSVTANFADPLYEMHDAVLKILHRYWPDRRLAKDGPLLQMLGTDWARKTIDQNIWVEIMKFKAKVYSGEQVSYMIVGDCRFENEFDAFPEALRVRLECPEEIRKARCSMWRENTAHPSETGLDSYDLKEKFDLYLNTNELSVEACCDLIHAQLMKNSWLEKRNA